MQATAPWWGVPVIAGSFLIIGAVLGFVFSSIQDRRKFKHEAKLAHREKLLEIITALIEAHVLMQRMFTQIHGHSIVSSEESEAGLHDLHIRLQQLLLFDGDSALYTAADNSVMSAFEFMVSDLSSSDTDEAMEEYLKSYFRFIDTAREHLGIAAAKKSADLTITKEAS